MGITEEKMASNSRAAVSRRGFLQAAALGSAAMALAGTVGCSSGTTAGEQSEGEQPAAKTPPVEQEFIVACRGNCASNCSIKATVRDGKLVKTEAAETKHAIDRRMCVKGHTWPQRIYLPERLKYPMRRVEGTKRGEGQWEQITWDEAIDEIASKWKAYAEVDPTSVVFYRGAGNLGMTNNYYQNLYDGMGATRIKFSCDHAVTDFAGPKIIGYTPWFYGNDPKTMTESDVCIIWGDNVTGSSQTAYPYFQAARAAGVHMICVDPQYTVMAAKCDEWFQIRQGTDAALAMAMINIIVDEGLQSERAVNLLKHDTVGPWLVKEDGTYLRPRDLGQDVSDEENVAMCMGADGNMGSNFQEDFDPLLEGTFDLGGLKVTTAYSLLLARCKEMPVEKAAEVCDLSVDDIRYLATTCATKKVGHAGNTGVDHHTNGAAGYMGLFDLMMVAGNFGEPGQGQYGDASTNLSLGWTASSWTSTTTGDVGPFIYSPNFYPAFKNKTWQGKPYDPKMLYVAMGNILGINVGHNEWLEIFENMEFIVVADVVMTETTKYADIVLPAAEFFEYWDFNYSVNSCLSINEKALEPLYECKPDFEIANLLMEKLGLGDQAMDIEAFLAGRLDTDLAKANGLTWESFKEQKMIYTATDGFFLGASKPYLSPTGMLNLYFENIQPLNDYGQTQNGDLDQKLNAMVHFEPMKEAWNETVAGYEQSEHSVKYPINLMSWRSRFKTHTQFSTVPMLLELQADPVLYMNPADMAARGLAEGDNAHVFNDRGSMVIRVAEHPGIRPNTAMTDHGWRVDQYIEGSYQSLQGLSTHPLASQEAWFDVTVEIEKA